MKADRLELALQMIYQQKRLPLLRMPGLTGVELESYLSAEVQDLVVQLRAFVAGETGEPVTHYEHVTVADFPRWVPQWLRRRWTRTATHSVTTTPLTVYPELDLSWHQLTGRAVHIDRFDGGRIR